MIDIALAYLSKNPFKKNKESTKEGFEDKSKKSNGFFGILFIIMWVIIGILYLFIYFRLVAVAFGCSVGEGILAIFFLTIWMSWKLGTLIQDKCRASSSML